jgi:hypothetical protein
VVNQVMIHRKLLIALVLDPHELVVDQVLDPPRAGALAGVPPRAGGFGVGCLLANHGVS